MHKSEIIITFTWCEVGNRKRFNLYEDRMPVGEIEYRKSAKVWRCSMCRTEAPSLWRGCAHMAAAAKWRQEREKAKQAAQSEAAQSVSDEPAPKPRRRFAPCPD